MNRRSFLQITAGFCALIMAGCLGFGENTYTTVQRFHLLNTVEESVTVELRIERTDTEELVHEGRYELAPEDDGGNMLTLECVWPDEPLEISIRRASDATWNTIDTADDEGCMILLAEVNQQGISYFTSQEECPIRDPDCHPRVDK